MNKDYRGKSFKNLKLVNQDFSYADIRGTDFTNAILKNTNFTGVRAGLKLHFIIILFIGSLLLAAFSGISSAINTAIVYLPFLFFVKSSESPTKILDILSATTVAIDLLIFLTTVVSQGFLSALRRGLLFLLPFVIVATVFSGEIFKVGVSFFFGTAVLSLASISLSTSALSAAGAIVLLESIPILIIIAINLITTTVVSVVLYRIQQVSLILVISLIPTTLIMAGFGNYIAWQALKENEKFTWIRSLALTFASIGGTCFQESDLTNANFTLSLLKSTNFRGANLTRTYWFNAQKLNLSIVGESYLKNLQLRQLLVTGQGQDKNFDRFDLRGVNLQGANLVDASFIGADLSGADLQSSDLSRVKLVQTQLDRTDFTGATLTGAYIEDWGITSDTKFDEVRCEYVFMRLPTEENPNPWRKPDNWEEKFKDGDFAIFIKPIFATLDLYHTQNINFQAIAIALEQLSKKHPEAELEIVAMEKRGQDNFLVRAKTHPLADLSKLSAEYFSDYNQLKSLPQEALIFIITEQKNEIRMLAGRPSIYAETFQQQGDIVSEKSENSTYNLNHAKFGGGFAGDGGTQIGGTFNDYSTAPTAQPNSTVKTILILAANPKATLPLRLNEEVREIDSGLQRAKKHDQFELKQKWAVRIQDVYQSLLDFKPQFVHFSGHGSGDDGLVLEDDNGEVRLVDTAALAELFKLFSSSIECVVFNACYSEVQAQAVVQHIPYVIGMNKEIGDFAAIKFATGFYNAVGSGESVELAYKLGCSVIQLEGIPEHLTPQLKKRG